MSVGDEDLGGEAGDDVVVEDEDLDVLVEVCRDCSEAQPGAVRHLLSSTPLTQAGPTRRLEV